MTSYTDIEEFEIKNPKLFLGFIVGSICFVVLKLYLTEVQSTNTIDMFTT